MKSPESVQNSVAKKIRFGMVSLSVLPLLIGAIAIGATAYWSARDALEVRLNEQLAATRQIQSQAIQSYIGDLANVTQQTAQLPFLVEAAQNLGPAFSQLKARADKQIGLQRDELSKYYNGPFAEEYAKRNGKRPGNPGNVIVRLPEETVAAQFQYLANNANPVGKKDELNAAPDGSDYSRYHAAIHPTMRTVVRKFGLYDLFIVDAQTGFVAYSFFKEIDFGTSLIDGPFAQTALGKAFVESKASGKVDSAWLSDFAPYFASYEDQAAFLSTPIVRDGKTVAVLIVQVPIDQINATMTFRGKWDQAGMGRTGETYLVGTDLTPRSIARGLVENKEPYLGVLASVMQPERFAQVKLKNSDVGLRASDTVGVKAAAAGERGQSAYVGPMGREVLGAFAPVAVLNQRFGIVAEIDQAEAYEPVNGLAHRIAMAVLGFGFVLAGIVFWLASRFAKVVTDPIKSLRSTVNELNDGNFEARSPLTSKDEFGALGGALNHLLDDRLASAGRAVQENEALNNSVINIMQAVGTIATTKDLSVRVPMTEDVTGAISDALNLLNDETSRVLKAVRNVSKEVSDASMAVQAQSDSASAAASREQHEVGLAAGELAQAAMALNDIAHRASVCSESAERAVLATADALAIVDDTVAGVAASRDLIRETEKRIKRLGERSQEIGQVVNLIQSISERTGILALNASMHAASAGEAGRSFAVVADEVRRLSESSRDATSQISRLVTAIQTETNDTVLAMNTAISQVVEINRLAGEAGREMQRTQDETSHLATDVRDIARTSSKQAEIGATLQERAKNIQLASAETAKQLSAQSAETTRLVGYSRSLLEEVGVFKLQK
jgi:methyl-accepting chemotaxis protein